MITEAVEHLKSGGVVAYPTETLYGFGVDAENEDALERLHILKGREKGKPFSVLIPKPEDISSYAPNLSSNVQELIQKYWPGPLTLVLPSRLSSPHLMGPSGGIGFRCSPHPIASELVTKFGRCITATSANRAGEVPAQDTDMIKRAFSQQDDIFLLDGGRIESEVGSTVVDCTNSDQLKLIREGAIPWKDIQHG